MKPTLLILAAGMGSRYGGLKQLDEFGPNGETIMDYSVQDAVEAGFGKIVFVIRKDFEEAFRTQIISKYQDKVSCETVFQEKEMFTEGVPDSVMENRKKPWGTGHAILVARDVIDTPFAAINADDFYGADAFVKMAKFLIENEDDEKKYAMIAYELPNTLSEYGNVNRGICEIDTQNNLVSIFEGLKIQRNEEGKVIHLTNNEIEYLPEDTLVSMNFWGFHKSIFKHIEAGFAKFLKTLDGERQDEYYIPKVVDELMSQKKITVSVITTHGKWHGVTYQEDRKAVELALKAMG